MKNYECLPKHQSSRNYYYSNGLVDGWINENRHFKAKQKNAKRKRTHKHLRHHKSRANKYKGDNKMITGYTFAEAFQYAKDGYKITRAGWNGKGQWVSWTPPKTLDLEFDKIWTLPIRQVAEQNGGKVELMGYFNMKLVNNKILLGWVPTITDIQAQDWLVLL